MGKEPKKAAGQNKLDAIIDCAGTTERRQLDFSRLGINGYHVDVGFISARMDILLIPRVSGEQTFHSSFWGNNADLIKVMALAVQGRIQNTIETIAFEDINTNIDLMRENKIVGRAVVRS
ncbi:MAG TPA: hypothetical protein VFQ91_27510 [Bryobacteraceae bacterium]|nr:hypothetical protein [Bryobacteraceae bacterium]